MLAARSSGTEFVLFASSGTATGSHTQMGFRVADINAEVRELKQRGVQFEEYDFPSFDKVAERLEVEILTDLPVQARLVSEAGREAGVRVLLRAGT